MESQKTLLIDNIVIPDVANIIKGFAFYDINSLEYAKFWASKRKQVLKQINSASSRKNGFYGQEEMDTISEHWTFMAQNNNFNSLQAVNCELCGNYIHVSSYYRELSDRCWCKCQVNENICFVLPNNR
jgi:hypothetical protein